MNAIERIREELEDGGFIDENEVGMLLAEIGRLRDGVRWIAQARCLRNLGPPGCAGTCVTCQARALLEENHDDR